MDRVNNNIENELDLNLINVNNNRMRKMSRIIPRTFSNVKLNSSAKQHLVMPQKQLTQKLVLRQASHDTYDSEGEKVYEAGAAILSNLKTFANLSDTSSLRDAQGLNSCRTNQIIGSIPEVAHHETESQRSSH